MTKSSCSKLMQEWDFLRGITIVTTPHFRVVTDSAPCFPGYCISARTG
ncbi:MAG: hypothetical protein ABIN58_04065 [candidate division WOR-3 bacterium]